MTTTAQQRDWQAWNQRNSDGKLSLGDERMTGESRRVQPPPSFLLTDVALPPGTRRLTHPDSDSDGRALRHTHVWNVEEPSS